jgi:amino acid adenylation domain-containing protein
MQARHTISPTGAAASVRLIERFFRCAIVYHDRPAVCCNDRSISYGQMALAVRRGAQRLIEQGAGPGDRIGVLLDDISTLPAAILSILDAGCVYVPLDAAHPAARRRAIADECRIELVITDAERPQVETSRWRLVEPARLDEIATDQPSVGGTEPLRIGSDLAAIVFTSGSTGRPKGVMQTHWALANYAANYCRALEIEPRDRLSMLYSYTFAAANLDILSALLSGACLCIHPIAHHGLAGLDCWLRDESVSILHTLPGVFRQLVFMTEDAAAFPSVRAVVLGGEAVLASDLELFRRHFRDDCKLVNHYAATELSVIAQFVGTKTTRLESAIVPVGYPPAGVEIIIEDEDGNEVAPGVTGRIAVRSRDMSAGYWHDDELTSRTFVLADSASSTYRTGDVGVINASGALVHLGRSDSRVKIRGQSVELAEVEDALLRLDGVRQCIVTTVTAQDGEPRLAAYVVGEAALDLHELRKRLRVALPEVMVPSCFAQLPAIPLTSTGKVVRVGLPPIPLGEPQRTGPLPRDDVERLFVRLWEETLNVRGIGTRDDFFALGGHSLAAARIFALFEREYGKRMPLSSMLQAPTIEQLAAQVRDGVGYAGGPFHLVKLREGNATPLFLVHGLRGGVIYLRELVSALERPCWAFEADGRYEGDMGFESLEELAASYIELLRNTWPGPYLLAGYSAGGLIAYEMARQLLEANAEVPFLGLVDTYAPVPDRHASWLGKKINHFAALGGLSWRERAGFALRTLERITRRERGRAGGPDVDRPLRRALLPLLRAYGPTGHYRGCVDLFVPAIPATDFRRSPTLGWARCEGVEFAIHRIPGDHRTVFESDNARVLATTIEAAIRRATCKSSD